MNLRYLKTFIDIAESGSIAGAGTRLTVSQSAASRQILEVEGESCRAADVIATAARDSKQTSMVRGRITLGREPRSRRVHMRCSGPGQRADVEDQIIWCAKLDFDVRRCRHIRQSPDVWRTERLEMLDPGIKIVDHQSDMMKPAIIQADTDLISCNLQDGDAEVAVSHDDA